MELELRRLEDLAESIVNDFAYMRAREEEMRDTNGIVIIVIIILLISVIISTQSLQTQEYYISVYFQWDVSFS